ncbi:hypothetical protein [Nocardia fusca]|uniref:Haloacid dehalogenase-like hydrolase n=1 Tax=Nocardia fusca TaxID=941183 RepID=A0ABV3FF98_9NOCA
MTAALMSSTACGTDDSQTAPEDCSTLDAGQSWYGDNKERIARFISETGRCGAAGSGMAPLAVFDWDNTVVKNDVGVPLSTARRPRLGQRGPALHSRGHRGLATACGDAEPNTALRTSTNAACADELISVADSAETTTGKPAFAISTIAAPTPATRLSFS